MTKIRENTSPSARWAFVLVDLLAAVSLVGLLLMLLLPAIQAAREATRNSQCKHHLRELAFGCLKHENAHRTFPYSGWSFAWMGDPDQGIGPQQPGSWGYTIGRFLDVKADFNLGAGLQFDEKKRALAKQMSIVVPVFHCPSRRPAVALPSRSAAGTPCDNGILPKNAFLPEKVAKSDYAINGGNGSGWDGGAGGSGGVPSEDCLISNELSDGPSYPNCNWHIYSPSQYWQRFNGVSGWRIGAHVSQISDGVSKTVLVGEKFMQPLFYENSCPSPGNQPSKGNAGDNGSMYMGWDIDIARTGSLLRDYNANPPNSIVSNQFGSAHPHAANFAFCDGSVRAIRYEVSNFARLITRNDSDAPPL
ncbi:MAG: DUF1559 domain-containing protein [Pirellulales bacterium]